MRSFIKKMSMKLSVIIPVYRVESTLERCVESIVGQSYRDLEIILVDDGSPDRCPQMCDDWAARDSRIRVIHKQNGGLSDARNAAIERATGDYLTFVDSDDFIAKDTYAPLMDILLEHNDIDMLEYPVFWHYGSAEQQRLDFGDNTYTNMADYWLQSQAYSHAYACNKIYKRQLFTKVQFPKGQVFEDIATLPILLGKVRLLCTTTKGCYYYCINPQGITITAQGEQLELLLHHHLKIMADRQLPVDDKYYMHVLNIQLDVCRLLGKAPELPARHVQWNVDGLTTNEKIKAFLLNLIGINALCKIYKIPHRILSGH